jgi:hypothetical protein
LARKSGRSGGITRAALFAVRIAEPEVRIHLPPAGSGESGANSTHNEIEPIEVEGFYQKPRCFAFPSHGVQDATPPGREWFLELIVEHLPSHRGPAMIGDTERLIPNLYREAAEELRQWARRARLTDIRSDLLELSARYERLASYSDAAIRLGAPGYPHGELIPIANDPSNPGSDRGQPPFTPRDRTPRPPPTTSACISQ